MSMLSSKASQTAAIIPGLIQAGVGFGQLRKGRRMGEGLEDPMMPIPQSALEALQNARVMASRSNMPGYENMVENMSQILSGAVGNINRAATSSPEALGAILNAVGMQTKASNDIGRMNAEVYMNNQEQLRNELRNIASYEDKKWGTNVLNPFLRQAAAAQALVGSGMQNLFSGISNVAGVKANQFKSGVPDIDPRSMTNTTPGVNPASSFSPTPASGFGFGGNEVPMQYDPVTGQWGYQGTTQPTWNNGSSAPLIPAIYSE